MSAALKGVKSTAATALDDRLPAAEWGHQGSDLDNLDGSRHSPVALSVAAHNLWVCLSTTLMTQRRRTGITRSTSAPAFTCPPSGTELISDRTRRAERRLNARSRSTAGRMDVSPARGPAIRASWTACMQFGRLANRRGADGIARSCGPDRRRDCVTSGPVVIVRRCGKIACA